MLIVGENLKALIQQYQMSSQKGCFDETCIQLSLGSKYIRFAKPSAETKVLTYGEEIPAELVVNETIKEEGLILQPKEAVLACSAEKIKMPAGYFGLLQTKGSLARMFVSLHFSDGQIDPGFEGKVTFELFNAGEYPIRIHKNQAVGNLYVLKASTDMHAMYNGRYGKATGPTIQKPLTDE